MPKVRTTIKPGEVMAVEDHELVDLDRQGLLLEVVPDAVPIDSTTTITVTGTSDTVKKK